MGYKVQEVSCPKVFLVDRRSFPNDQIYKGFWKLEFYFIKKWATYRCIKELNSRKV